MIPNIQTIDHLKHLAGIKSEEKDTLDKANKIVTEAGNMTIDGEIDDYEWIGKGGEGFPGYVKYTAEVDENGDVVTLKVTEGGVHDELMAWGTSQDHIDYEIEDMNKDINHYGNEAIIDDARYEWEQETGMYSGGHEDMDGDHDSAMASAGMGTDEDYGYYGESAEIRKFANIVDDINNPRNVVKEVQEFDVQKYAQLYSELGSLASEAAQQIERWASEGKFDETRTWDLAEQIMKPMLAKISEVYDIDMLLDDIGESTNNFDGRFQNLETEATEQIPHNCAVHVEHKEFGKGFCIREQHTLAETGDVTHYNVRFRKHGIKEMVAVADLKILKERHHTHKKGIKSTVKKMSEETGIRKFSKIVSEGDKQKETLTEAGAKTDKQVVTESIKKNPETLKEYIETLKEERIDEVFGQYHYKATPDGFAYKGKTYSSEQSARQAETDDKSARMARGEDHKDLTPGPVLDPWGRPTKKTKIGK